MSGGEPVITAQIDTRYGRVYRDARAVVRPNTALQDMYLDVVDPGTPSAGLARPGEPLPASATDTSVSIDDALDVFGADARASLRTLLDNLGNGLADRGAALREGFVQLVPFLRIAGSLTRQLSDRSVYVRDLVHNASTLMADLAARQRALRTLVGSGSATLGTLARGSVDLNATLAALPPTLAGLRSSLGALDGVLGSVDGAVRSLGPVAQSLPGALAALRGLSAEATPAVRALRTPVARLVPLAQTLVALAASLSRSVSALLPQVPALDRTTADLVACRTGVEGFFQWNASFAKYGDARGLSPRGNFVFGAQSTGVLHSPFEYAPAACAAGRPIGGRIPTARDLH
jgi:ABC-type transporter Mla subunit MlaD